MHHQIIFWPRVPMTYQCKTFEFRKWLYRKEWFSCQTTQAKCIGQTEDTYKNGHLGSISPTFYAKLLCVQILAAQIDNQVISVFLRFWDLCMQKFLLECWWNWHLPIQQIQANPTKRLFSFHSLTDKWQKISYKATYCNKNLTTENS